MVIKKINGKTTRNYHKKKTELMKKTNRNIIIASEERKVGDENSL